MQLTFERGTEDAPKGHAILYFRERSDPTAIWATYLVVAPIAMDLARYMPPLFASQLSTAVTTTAQVFPLPPFPERAEDARQLERLAAAREDDLLYGGEIDPRDLHRVMALVSEIGQRYVDRYHEYVQSLPVQGSTGEREDTVLDVEDLLYQVMTDQDKVEKLARLTGTLRYAVEGHDRALVDDTIQQMERLGRHLPEKYRVSELIEAARCPGPTGQRLTELYVERCYHLLREEYAALPGLDRQIAEIRAQMQ